MTAQSPMHSDSLADEDLMLDYRAGNRSAFTELFHRHRDAVTSYAWRMLGRREEAEEVCLEAFCRIVEGAWQATGSFRGFLFTVVHRLCLDRLRRRSRAARAYRLVQNAGAFMRTPEDVATGDEECRRLDRALSELPEAHRAVLLLYYSQELPSKTVASILGCTDQQVRSRLSYARGLLRKHLSAQGSSR